MEGKIVNGKIDSMQVYAAKGETESMKNYKIKVNMEIVESEELAEENPKKINNGGFEFRITGSQGSSIDKCERALLEINYEAMREVMAVHFTEVSKKKRKSK